MANTKIPSELSSTPSISDSGDATAITIDSSELIGINTASPQKRVHILGQDGSTGLTEGNSRTQLFLENNQACYINIASANNNKGGIFFSDADANNRGAVRYDHNGDYLTFNTAASERVRILSGGGITFNGDTSTSNALDDYEEGQWTPTIQGSSTNGTYTYGTNHGEYMKVGNIVVANFRIDQIGVSSAGSGNIEIHGFPFTAKSTTLQYYWGSVILEYFDTAPSTVALSVGMRDGNNNALIWESRDTTTNGVVSITDINNTSNADVWGQVTYMT